MSLLFSLDTNIFILGLRSNQGYAVDILNNLFRFQFKIAPQVEHELRHNLSERELKLFYRLINALPNVTFNYQIIPDRYYQLYRQQGLKHGDATIAAFCDWQEISLFVSENRHFLKSLKETPFEVINAMTFCQRFLSV